MKDLFAILSKMSIESCNVLNPRTVLASLFIFNSGARKQISTRDPQEIRRVEAKGPLST